MAVALLLAVLSIQGCNTDRFNDFVFRRDSGDQGANPVLRKSYTTPSMSRTELAELLEMSLHRGEFEKYGDLIFRERSAKRNKNPVVFSHRTHRAQFTCRVCHLELEFSMKKGESGITREDYLDGRYCGACHNGQIAFHVDSCNLCHVTVDKEGDYQTKGGGISSGSEKHYGDGVNWVKAVESGVVSPRKTLLNEGEGQPMMPLPDHLKDDLRWTTRVPRVIVRFPHEEHVEWLDCANCHPDLFTVEQTGTVAFDKEKILYGMYCGTCHMTVAFPVNGCQRCHPCLKDRY